MSYISGITSCRKKKMAIIKMKVNTGRSNFKSREQEKPVNK